MAKKNCKICGINHPKTMGDIYNPLIEFAKKGDKKGYIYMGKIGMILYLHNKDKAKNHKDGIEAAKVNLDYYCQYSSPDIALKVKRFYNLGEGFRTLFGKTDIPINLN